MRNGGTDWIVYVAWKTITEWKQNVRAAVDARESMKATSQQDADRPDDYPFQYASNQPRFINLQMTALDKLWIGQTIVSFIGDAAAGANAASPLSLPVLAGTAFAAPNRLLDTDVSRLQAP